MNVVCVNGYVLQQGAFRVGENGKEFNFYVSCSNPSIEEASSIPCKTVGILADKIFAEISDGCYVECFGELVRKPNKPMYVLVTSMIYKKPKGRKMYSIRSTDFLQIYQPQEILNNVFNNIKE